VKRRDPDLARDLFDRARVLGYLDQQVSRTAEPPERVVSEQHDQGEA
jgi:hypothetical protein